MAIKVCKDLDDLEEYGRQVCRRAAGRARDELYQTTLDAFHTFYSDYEPKWYKRHYTNFSDLKGSRPHAYKKYYANDHNVLYHGGIEITTGDMYSYYQDPVYEVSDLVWHGFHGSPAKSTVEIRPVMNPSPIEIVTQKQQEIIDHIQDYIDEAE